MYHHRVALTGWAMSEIPELSKASNVPKSNRVQLYLPDIGTENRVFAIFQEPVLLAAFIASNRGNLKIKPAPNIIKGSVHAGLLRQRIIVFVRC